MTTLTHAEIVVDMMSALSLKLRTQCRRSCWSRTQTQCRRSQLLREHDKVADTFEKLWRLLSHIWKEQSGEKSTWVCLQTQYNNYKCVSAKSLTTQTHNFWTLGSNLFAKTKKLAKPCVPDHMGPRSNILSKRSNGREFRYTVLLTSDPHVSLLACLTLLVFFPLQNIRVEYEQEKCSLFFANTCPVWNHCRRAKHNLRH